MNDAEGKQQQRRRVDQQSARGCNHEPGQAGRNWRGPYARGRPVSPAQRAAEVVLIVREQEAHEDGGRAGDDQPRTPLPRPDERDDGCQREESGRLPRENGRVLRESISVFDEDGNISKRYPEWQASVAMIPRVTITCENMFTP